MNRLSDIANRYLGGDSSSQCRHPAVTPADFSELQPTARLLRIDLDQVIEDEVANEEACRMANDNIVRLRTLAAERRRERDALRRKADEARSVWKDVLDACSCEERKRSALQEEVSDIREDTRQAARDIIERREEALQIRRKIEMNGAETAFRLRAEVQNMKMECEMERIRLRKLKSERDGIHCDLEEKRRHHEEIQCYVASLRDEIDVARTELEMNKIRFQLLADQLHGIGGKIPSENVLSSVKDMFINMSVKQIPIGRKNDLAQSTAMRTICENNKSLMQEHRCPENVMDESNQHNSQQQTQSSLLTSDQLHKSTRIFLIGVDNKNNGELCNNVYSKPGHQGISILCKDDESIVSALTVDETEFPSLSDRAEDQNK